MEGCELSSQLRELCPALKPTFEIARREEVIGGKRDMETQQKRGKLTEREDVCPLSKDENLHMYEV